MSNPRTHQMTPAEIRVEFEGFVTPPASAPANWLELLGGYRGAAQRVTDDVGCECDQAGECVGCLARAYLDTTNA